MRRGGGGGAERAPPAAVHFCCTHTHTHTRMYIFAFFVLLGSFGKRYKRSPTYTLTHRQRRRSSACESKCCSERKRESRRDNVVVVVVVGSGPSVERVQNDEVRLKYVSKPNNCRYCHYFWPTFKWKRERALATPLSLPLRQQRQQRAP